MPTRAPLNLDMSCHTSGTLPDGRTLPLAWELTTGKIYVKVAPYFPWNNRDGNRAAVKLIDKGGVYLAVMDEWFRGVWLEAPQQVFDADYTRKQQRELSRGGGSRLALDSITGSGSYPLGLTTGGGGMQKTGSTTIEGDYEEVEDDEDDETENGETENGEAEPETATGRKRAKKKSKR